jgi:hypothetical protein
MDYATAADVLVTFEGPASAYEFSYTNPEWVDALPASHFAHLVYAQPSADDVQIDVDLAHQRKAGMLYVTDDVFSPNPWDTLATYWLSELAMLSVP